MLIPEASLPLNWHDRMQRVLSRRFLPREQNMCSACGHPAWPAESDDVLRKISLTRPVLIKWTDDEPWTPYAVEGLHVYQFCAQCREFAESLQKVCRD